MALKTGASNMGAATWKANKQDNGAVSQAHTKIHTEFLNLP